MNDVKALPRKFKYGQALLDDIDSNASPEEVMAMYADLYPDLGNAVVEGPEVTEDAMVYAFNMKVGTKGTVNKRKDLREEADFELMDSISRSFFEYDEHPPMLLPSEMVGMI